MLSVSELALLPPLCIIASPKRPEYKKYKVKVARLFSPVVIFIRLADFIAVVRSAKGSCNKCWCLSIPDLTGGVAENNGEAACCVDLMFDSAAIWPTFSRDPSTVCRSPLYGVVLKRAL